MPLERVSQGFKDVSATFKANPLTSDVVIMKNAAAISRSVRNIVLTSPGEKFFDPDFDNNGFNVTIVYKIVGVDIPPQRLEFVLESTR